ncbi:hypothetical protein GX408_18200 [bacterium]|nr:hypothetical protein [bacterium]
MGSRLELFADDYLIDRLKGEARLCLHHPEPREIVLVHDAPWEGNGSGYHSIFQDGKKYRMYYKAWRHSAGSTSSHPIFCCYAESDDGIHWIKPELGLYEFQGSKANNIVFISGRMDGADADGGHPAVFRDENPDAEPESRYKAILRARSERGIIPFASADGIHWRAMSDKPVITDGAFDSQNLAFWDKERQEYRAYWRYFSEGSDTALYRGLRAIRTARSKDLLTWFDQHDLSYVDSPPEQLYTNVIKPYHRAPHLFLGFPMRYIDRGAAESLQALPEREHRTWRSSISPRYGSALTDALFMISRDGVRFKRWNEAFLRPGIERLGTWNYGHLCTGWSLVVTPSALEGGAPDELSLYAVESYWTDNSSALRRYSLRMDGFVSVSAPMAGGELVTKPLIFAGSRLVINFSTSAAGEVKVEIQDAACNPLPGYAEKECPALFGDTIERMVSWKKGNDLAALAGRAVRLRFILKDADLYSIRFKNEPTTHTVP